MDSFRGWTILLSPVLLMAWIPWALVILAVTSVLAWINRDNIVTFLRKLLNFEIATAGAVLAGSFIGTVLGFIFLSFGSLIGRSGSTGTEYLGYWDPLPTLSLAAVYGSFLGGSVHPLPILSAFSGWQLGSGHAV